MTMEPQAGLVVIGETAEGANAIPRKARALARPPDGATRPGAKPARPGERAAARRRQVLAAAEECFRDHGFHGTSMAQISRAARMSPGHIYHYFKNKEDIILAIVRMDMHDTLDLIREKQGRDGDWLQAMLAGLAHGVARMLDPAKAAIALEVMSEAAHNPRVAEMIRQMDQVFRREIAAFILRGRQARGIEAPEKDLEAKVEVMCAIFGGLTMRSICKPGADLATMVRVVNQAMMHLICD